MLVIKTIFGKMIFRLNNINYTSLNLSNYLMLFKNKFKIKKKIGENILYIDFYENIIFYNYLYYKLIYGDRQFKNKKKINSKNTEIKIQIIEYFYPFFRINFKISKSKSDSDKNIIKFDLGNLVNGRNVLHYIFKFFKFKDSNYIYTKFNTEFISVILTRKLYYNSPFVTYDFYFKIKSILNLKNLFQYYSFSKLVKLGKKRKPKNFNLTFLQLIGDIPNSKILPSDRILFICKLNPLTNEEDLYNIFIKYGKILSVKIIRDKITNTSLNYGFIEYCSKKCCENALFNLNNCQIDDCRIKLDFNQSAFISL